MTSIIVPITLAATGVLCVLNTILAIVFRKRHTREIITYCVAALIELAIMVFVLGLPLGFSHLIPYHLPSVLSYSRAEIGAAIAIGIGLCPAAYWHRVSLTQLRTRIEEDAKVMDKRDASVRVRTPGEWIN